MIQSCTGNHVFILILTNYLDWPVNLHHQKIRVNIFHAFPRFTFVPKIFVHNSSEFLTFNIYVTSRDMKFRLKKQVNQRRRLVSASAPFTSTVPETRSSPPTPNMTDGGTTSPSLDQLPTPSSSSQLNINFSPEDHFILIHKTHASRAHLATYGSVERCFNMWLRRKTPTHPS